MKLFIPLGLSCDEVGKLIPRFRRLNLLYKEEIEYEYYNDILELNNKEIGGVIFKDHSEQLQMIRNSGIPCMFYTADADKCDEFLKHLPKHQSQKYSRFHDSGYEVTTKGDRRFSPFCIHLENGYTLENYYQLIIKGGKLMGYDDWRQMKGKNAWNVIFYNGSWSREEVLNDESGLYIFTDNLLRTSGRRIINPESSYSKRYRKSILLKYPNSTQACIRGLENAFPITTMKDCYRTQLTDEDYDLLAETWNKEVSDIKEAYKSGNFDHIVIPNRVFGNGTYSRIVDNNLLFDLLCDNLRKLGIEQNVSSISSIYNGLDLYNSLKQIYIRWLVENPEMLIELYCLTYNKVLTDMFMNSELSQAKIYADILNRAMV